MLVNENLTFNSTLISIIIWVFLFLYHYCSSQKAIVRISEWISFFSTTMCLFCIYHRPCLSIIDKKFYGKSNSIFFCNHNSNEITFYCCRPIISSHCGFNGNNNRIFAEQNIYKSNFINNKNAMECGFILFSFDGKRHFCMKSCCLYTLEL